MSTQSLSSNSGIDIYSLAWLALPGRRFHALPLQQQQDASLQLQNMLHTSTVPAHRPGDEPKPRFPKEFALLTLILKAKDGETYRHSRRVQALTHRFTRSLALTRDDVTTIGAAALLHDIGKIGIDDALLRKTTPLSAEEFEVIQAHSTLGALMVGHFKAMKDVAPLVYYHHERWDGKGYPTGLRGEAIPLGARIIAIVDAFDAMTSQRIYQAARTPAAALAELCRCAGTQFDPRLVACFCKLLEPAPLASVS